MNLIQYLTPQDVYDIHEVIIQQYGGSFGLRDIGLLDSAVASPRQTMFDEELYPDLPTKATILLLGLVKNHPFIDGNKRTAYLATLRFLEMNGNTFDANDTDLFNFIIDVAASDFDKDTVTEWFRTHIRPIPS
jgi:death on curing protein